MFMATCVQCFQCRFLCILNCDFFISLCCTIITKVCYHTFSSSIQVSMFVRLNPNFVCSGLFSVLLLYRQSQAHILGRKNVLLSMLACFHLIAWGSFIHVQVVAMKVTQVWQAEISVSMGILWKHCWITGTVQQLGAFKWCIDGKA